jgi:hypothetical protein
LLLQAAAVVTLTSAAVVEQVDYSIQQHNLFHQLITQ